MLSTTKEVKPYRIEVRGLGPCEMYNTSQIAILQYEGSKDAEPSSPPPPGNFTFNGILRFIESTNFNYNQPV